MVGSDGLAPVEFLSQDAMIIVIFRVQQTHTIDVAFYFNHVAEHGVHVNLSIAHDLGSGDIVVPEMYTDG